ncbi:MAG: hypothetical protein NC115_01880 [Bacteroidales bacterium]|nr:hypothetical protein [Bacteroidales bacterium]
MNWKEELQNYIGNEEWEKALSMMPDVLVRDNYSIDAYLNYFFIFEEIVTCPSIDFSDSLIDWVKRLMLPLHEDSLDRYSDNAEYLFWHGFMMIRCNWICYPDDLESEQMLRKAHEMEPENKLYAWAVLDGIERQKCEMEIVNNEDIMNCIISKGPVGVYLEGILINSVKHMKMQ